MMPPRCLGHTQCPCPKCSGLELSFESSRLSTELINSLRETIKKLELAIDSTDAYIYVVTDNQEETKKVIYDFWNTTPGQELIICEGRIIGSESNCPELFEYLKSKQQK